METFISFLCPLGSISLKKALADASAFCGAGYGNRTRLCGLGSDRSTDELTLHIKLLEQGTGILRRLRRLRADCIFLCFLHCMQKKRRFCAAKMHSVEPQRFSRHVCPAKTKKPFLTE